MIRVILELIAIFDLEINLLKERKIKDLQPWQILEQQLVERLAKEESDIPRSVYQAWQRKVQEKQYLIERHLAITRKFFDLLVGQAPTYKDDGKTSSNNSAIIIDKQI